MRRIPLAAATLGALLVAPATADWLVHPGAGLTETRGAWELRGRNVVFEAPSGTLMSVPAETVDLPASAFLSWQVGNRRHAPMRPDPSAGPDASTNPAATPAPLAGECVGARLLAVASAETLTVEIDGRRETVHLACLDAPETRHRFPELAAYGTTAERAVASRAGPGSTLCLIEDAPPRRDREGHRVAYVRLVDGADLGADLVGGGLGISRRGDCARAAVYRGLEDSARVAGAGLWGPAGSDASIAVVAQASGSAARPRSARAGGRS
jgi:endonuclease YncB( thermonuclease family)